MNRLLPFMGLSIVLACATTAVAQVGIGVGAQPQPAVIQLTQFEQTGKVIGLDARALHIEVLGTKCAALVDSPEIGNMPTMVELNAKAAPTFLKTGMNVRFDAKFDVRGKRIVEPISNLTIFAQSVPPQFGVFDGQPFAAPVGPQPALGGAADAVGVAPPVADGAPLAPKAAPAADGMKFVVGQISRVRSNEITVQLPNGQLEAKLAEDVAIDVNVTDKRMALGLLLPGDSVHVAGGATEAGKLYATKIIATLERPLGRDGKTKPAPPAPADKPAEPAPDAIDPREDFGIAATDAAAEAERDAKPSRARILKVN